MPLLNFTSWLLIHIFIVWNKQMPYVSCHTRKFGPEFPCFWCWERWRVREVLVLRKRVCYWSTQSAWEVPQGAEWVGCDGQVCHAHLQGVATGPTRKPSSCISGPLDLQNLLGNYRSLHSFSGTPPLELQERKVSPCFQFLRKIVKYNNYLAILRGKEKVTLSRENWVSPEWL